MNLAELKKAVVDKQLDNVYIFTGDEIKVMNIYIHQIATTLGRNLVRKEAVGEIFKTLKVRKLTKESNAYVILDDFAFLKEEKYWEQLMNDVKEHTVILVYSQLDKRSKFYKTYKDKICEFEKLNETILAKYVQKEIKLSDQSAKELSLMCDCSYNRILLEVDKLKQLSQVYNITHEETFSIMKKEELIYTQETEIVFKLVDAICKRDKLATFELLQDLDVVKDSPIAILSLLYTNIKSMLLVHVCPPGTKVGETTGLTGWQIKTAYEKGYNYEPNELLNTMKQIKYVDEAIKIGKIEPQFALPYLITQVM